MAHLKTPRRPALPRELLKWLQDIKLSFYPKNPRRDLSNGFLVAEILRWYQPRRFSTNSYRNGCSTACKVDNWYQIQRALLKQGIRLPEDLVGGTIHCTPGSAELLLQYLYLLFTYRTRV